MSTVEEPKAIAKAPSPDGSRSGRVEQVAVVSVVVATVVGLAVAAAVVLVKAYVIVLALFAAIIVGEAARPLVDRVSARVPRGAAVVLVFTAILAAIALAWGYPIRVLAPQFVDFWQSLPTVLNSRMLAAAGSSLNLQTIQPLIQGVLRVESGVAAVASTLALVLLMAVFWLGASDALRAFLLTLVSPEQRREFDSLFRDMGSQLGMYVSGTLVNGAIVAVASIVALAILRSPFPVVLGLIQGLVVAIPYVGTLIGVLTVGAVVMATQGWSSALVAIAATAAIATLEGSFIAPLVFKKSLNIDPLSTTLAIAIGGTLFGIGGVVLAVPAATVLQILVVRVAAPVVRANRDE